MPSGEERGPQPGDEADQERLGENDPGNEPLRRSQRPSVGPHP